MKSTNLYIFKRLKFHYCSFKGYFKTKQICHFFFFLSQKHKEMFLLLGVCEVNAESNVRGTH